MRRTAVGVLVVLVVAAGVTAAVLRARDDHRSPGLAELKTGVGRVETLKCDGSPLTIGGHPATGSGFLVGSQVVVSAEHGMWVGLDKPACKMQVRFGDEVVPVTSVRVWADSRKSGYYARRGIDLATLTLARPVNGHIFSFAPEPVPRGSQVSTVGYPLGGPLKQTTGVLTRHLTDYDVPTVATTIDILGGNSGGPILNHRGEVVSVVRGVVVSGSLTTDHNNRFGGVDLQRWWGSSLVADLCKSYPQGGIPNCGQREGNGVPSKEAIPVEKSWMP